MIRNRKPTYSTRKKGSLACVKSFSKKDAIFKLVIAMSALSATQDPPHENPYRVRDIMTSFGDAFGGAVSVLNFYITQCVVQVTLS